MGLIHVENLGKAYKQYKSRWSRLLEWVIPGRRCFHENKWVLSGINFSVQPGEALAIVGINGAGKSTLLKLITGTTQPTTGTIAMHGRVAALLELGMGFHPDFTGRQNAYMAGQLLGINTDEITNLMPEIEAFAEIGEYIDMPVRIYSSGMQMRLAFSVATSVRPDILIVDEALSVGDAYFQHKSFDRIRQFNKLGTTLLIVSHDKQAIQSVCDRAILLSSGQLAMEGTPMAVLDYYNALLAEGQPKSKILENDDGSIVGSGTQEAVMSSVRIKNLAGDEIYDICVGEPIEVHVDIVIKKDIPSLVLGCGFRDKYGQMVFGTNTYFMGAEVKDCKLGDALCYVISCDANLGEGTYSVNVAIHAGENHTESNYHWIDRAAIVNVINRDKYRFVGVSWNPMHALIRRTRQGKQTTLYGLQDFERPLQLAKANYGPMLVYPSDKVIGASLLYSGGFQENKIKEVIEFLRQKFSADLDLFVDIGANIGTHTIYALKVCGFKKALCFEPNIDNYKLLTANIAINGLAAEASARMLALSDRAGTIEMELSSSNYGDHRIKASSTEHSFGEESERTYVSVPVNSLNGYSQSEDLDWSRALVWMDTQGHEGKIFEGGDRFLRSNRSPKFIVSEYWPYGIERAMGQTEYFKFVSKCKKVYDLNVVVDGGFKEVTLEDLKSCYDEMLDATKKEHHPHTDLLLIL